MELIISYNKHEWSVPKTCNHTTDENGNKYGTLFYRENTLFGSSCFRRLKMGSLQTFKIILGTSHILHQIEMIREIVWIFLGNIDNVKDQ